MLTSGLLYSADPDVVVREQVIAASLRKVVPGFCASEGVPCCLSLPQGWVSEGFLTQLRGLAIRMDGTDPLLGECAGRRVSVRKLDWTGAQAARVQIVSGTYAAGESCDVFLSRRSGSWAVLKSVCEFYSIL
jgi:hypothetical protein